MRNSAPLPLEIKERRFKVITKLISQLVITIILCSVNLTAYAEVAGLKGEYYEKDGCIYLWGKLSGEERLAEQEYYKQRMIERTEQIRAEIQRDHEVRIETIKAQAMRDYLIAQGIPLREVANTLKETKVKQNVFIGNVGSYSSTGNVNNTSSSISKGGKGGDASVGRITNDNSAVNRNINTNDEKGKK